MDHHKSAKDRQKSASMKILIDGRFYGLEHAGLGRYTMGLVQSLKELDVDNEYVIMLRNKHYNELHLPDNWKKVKFNAAHYSFEEQFKIPFVVQKYQPDIFHAFHINVPIFYTGNYVVTIHDLIQTKYKRKASNHKLPLYLIKWLGINISAYFAVYRSSKVVVPTNKVKKDLLDKYKVSKKKISVIHEGVTVLSEGKGGDDDQVLDDLLNKRYLFYVGNAYPHKNLESAIDALKIYNKNNKDKMNLIIAGSRSVFKNKLEKLIAKKKMNKRVMLLGYVSDKNLKKLYKNSVAFIYPSLEEGFGLQGLEAMKNETLLICSDINVFHEVYKDNATYFDPKDAESISIAIKRAAGLNANERADSIKIAKKYADQYTWKKTAKKTLEVYREVFNNPGN